MDDVTQNAQNMESTRNDGPPVDENATSLPPRDTAAEDGRARRRMEEYLASEKGAAPRQQQQQPDAGAQRRAQITRELVTNDKLTDAQRADLTKELRASINNDPSNKPLAEAATLSDHRAQFGLDAPSDTVLPRVFQAEYEQKYSGHEQDFLAAAAADGLDAKLVRELRDYGVKMAVAAGGQRVSDEQWREFATRFKGRLSEQQMRGVVTWWITRVEGGS